MCSTRLGHEDFRVARVAKELALVLVDCGRVEGLLAVEALDALPVEGLPVGGHELLGRVDKDAAGRAPRGRGWRVRHPKE